MVESIFTKIIRGEIPAWKIYEDGKTVAFLDVRPIQLGQVLVVPKVEVDKFYDLADEDYAALFLTVKKVAKQMEKVLRKRIVVFIEGFEVPHVHVKLIPAEVGEDAHEFPREAIEEDLREMWEKLKMVDEK